MWSGSLAEAFDGLSCKLTFSLPEERCSKICVCLQQGSWCCITLVFLFLRQCFSSCFLVFINSVLSVPSCEWLVIGRYIAGVCLWISFFPIMAVMEALETLLSREVTGSTVVKLVVIAGVLHCRTCVLWRPSWIWNGGLQRAGGIHVYPVSQCEHRSFFFFFPVEFQLVSPLKKRPKCCKILFLNPVNCIYTEIVRKSVHYLRPFSISRILWWWPRTCLADLLTTTVWW